MDPGFDITTVLQAALARGNEPATVEFKAYIDPDTETLHWLLRAIAAMSNGDTTGFIFIGVDDRGPTLIGVDDVIRAKFDNTKIHNKVAALLTPTPKLDVHRFEFQGKKLVGIVVHPFTECPTFVAQGFNDYSPGTIMIRTPGGESAPASREADIRALCDRIVQRHAEKVAGLLKRYSRLAAAPALEVAAAIDGQTIPS